MKPIISNHKRLFTVLFIALCGIILPVHTAMAMFVVDNVRVDVTAENALKARDLAFEKAQIKAFDKLGKQLLTEGRIDSFTMPSAEKVSGFIQDFEITNEKLSNVRYIGTYTFRFSENAVLSYLNPSALERDLQNNADGTGAYAPNAGNPNAERILILPYYKDAAGARLWDADNQWRNILARDSLTQPRLVVPNGTPDDMRTVKNDESFAYTQAQLGQMLSRYRANRAVIALAQNTLGGGISIDLYSTTSARPAFIKRLDIRDNTPAAWDIASHTLSDTLLREYNPQPLPTNIAGSADAIAAQAAAHNMIGANVLRMEIPVKTLPEWSATYNALRRLPSVANVQIKALSPSRALVHLTHRGDMQALQRDLARANMTFSTVGTTDGTPVYSVQLNRYAPNYKQQF